MSTGRVRIYELSKELKLDNRGILDICKEIGVEAKSHSSTITEEDAARIRDKATQNGGATPAPAKPEVAAKPVAPTQKAAPTRILEVRKGQDEQEGDSAVATAPKPKPPMPSAAKSPSRPAPPRPRKRADGTDEGPSAPPKAPASAPAKPAASAPKAELSQKPTLKKPPQIVRKVAKADAPAPEGRSARPAPPSRPSKPKPTIERIVPKGAESPGKGPAKPADSPAEAPPKVVAPPPRPKLTRPPARSSAEPADADGSRPGRVEPPRRKVERPVKAGSRPRPDGPAKPSGKPKPTILEVRRPSPKPARPADDLKSPAVSPDEAAAQLLQKPTRPAPPSASDDEGDSDDGGSRYPTKLRRPMPSRPGKKSRDWTDGEREMRDRNTSKDKVKKRRSPITIEDDDDDFENELGGGGVASTQVSLSIARPPKPKSATASKPVSSTPATKAPTKRRSKPSRNRRDRQEAAASAQRKQRPEIISLTEGVSVAELADLCVIPETEIIKHLFLKGMIVNINQTLDIPTATMVAEAFSILVAEEEKESEAKKVTEMLDEADLENLQNRPPVVTIMGHVDHGKTTLLDAIRETKVAQGEAGGITQHIGAYHVDVTHGDKMQQIVFLDTPGHEAFTAMRARGARVTDIAILVVAADDGVRPQTLEALSHAKAAEVPIVVAINKIDKEGANPDRVMQELAEHSLVPEDWGGDTIMVPVSALKGENLDDLLENLLLVSEVEDLSANPDALAKGTVVEAHLDRARGPVATLLVQNGTLRVGDILLVGPCLGKVRATIDDRGDRVDEASPSFAVEVLGLNEVPAAGDEFQVYDSEREARAIASDRSDEQRQSRLQQAMASRRVSLTSLSDQAQEGELKELNLILKADVQGSVEAILGSLQQLPQDEVQIRVLLAAPGEVSETDVDLAYASDAVIVGFNTTLAPGARRASDEAGVDVREYSVIYKLLDDIQGAMEGLLDPEEVEEPLGQAEVREVFPVGRGAVAGCYIKEGKLIRDCLIRVHRDGKMVHNGRLDSLKRMRDDVKEVNTGFECGVGLDNFSGWQQGDVIESFKLVAKRRTLKV